MEIQNISFDGKMFVYAAESAYNPSKLKVTIPEVFIDKPTGPSKTTQSYKGNMSIFVNITKPAISNVITLSNCISLPVINNLSGSATVRYAGSNHTGSATVGLGQIHVGDRLIAEFIGDSPNSGVIIARC